MDAPWRAQVSTALLETVAIPDFPQDEKPPSEYEYACEVCGKELFYAGRGRKPKFCDEHRKGGSKAGGTPRTGKGNTQLAAQASEALAQLNALACMGLMVGKLNQTALALSTANDGFREQAYNALLTDPALCKTILKAGATSGKVSLLIAYGMLAAAVGPVGYTEYREVYGANRAEE